ncbi:hypothetical protein G7085_02460 [Tessaracoccus sp. HDW20]|uniref:hypothetical protein n=1 Tax=Tessaracoccus coleopterorum TaxID=2714950 RepID=UPI0018D30207|nr:hypothetical protein [Tessaracoccus coleopterorum]NHB83918.1 hypothetical protein [Tessaracoccus coleopterorum]
MMFHKTGTLAVAALAALSLSACGGEQSVTEACTIASTTVKAAESEITEAMSGATTGEFSKVVQGFETLGTTLSEAEGKITNAEVKAALGDFRTSIQDFSKLFEGATDGDLTALADKTEELQTISTKMGDSATKLGELCPAG